MIYTLQAFYERTGLMTFALVLISIQRITSDLPRAVQAYHCVWRSLAQRGAAWCCVGGGVCVRGA